MQSQYGPEVPTYHGPETVRQEESPPDIVIRRSAAPLHVHDYGALPPERTPAPHVVRLPSSPYLPMTHPIGARYSPPLSANNKGYTPDPSPSHERVLSASVPIPSPPQLPVSLRTNVVPQFRGACPDEPSVPYLPSIRPASTAYERSVRTPSHHEQALPEDQAPTISRMPPTPLCSAAPSPRMATGPPPRTSSSSPEDLTLLGDINAATRRDEIYDQLLERPPLTGVPLGPIEPPLEGTFGEVPGEGSEGDEANVPERASIASTISTPVPAPWSLEKGCSLDVA